MEKTERRILVSGTSSGLGKYIKEATCNSEIYIRKASISGYVRNYDLIIHTACGQKREEESKSEYIKTQINYYKNISNIEHHKFVYISSIDVNKIEDNPYAEAKRQIERMITNDNPGNLVIRPGLLIGSGMRYNTLAKIFLEKKPKFSLSKESYFYITYYESILKIALSDYSGIWTVCTSERLNLGETSRKLDCNARWGNYDYKPNIEDKNSNYYTEEGGNIDTINRLKLFFGSAKLKNQRIIV